MQESIEAGRNEVNEYLRLLYSDLVSPAVDNFGWKYAAESLAFERLARIKNLKKHLNPFCVEIFEHLGEEKAICSLQEFCNSECFEDGSFLSIEEAYLFYLSKRYSYDYALSGTATYLGVLAGLAKGGQSQAWEVFQFECKLRLELLELLPLKTTCLIDGGAIKLGVAQICLEVKRNEFKTVIDINVEIEK